MTQSLEQIQQRSRERYKHKRNIFLFFFLYLGKIYYQKKTNQKHYQIAFLMTRFVSSFSMIISLLLLNAIWDWVKTQYFRKFCHTEEADFKNLLFLFFFFFSG